MQPYYYLMKEQVQNNSFELLWDKFRLENNPNALSVIYFECYDILFNYGLKITNDRHIVEDSIQNLFSNLLKTRKNLGLVNNVVGYLLKSFRHQLVLDLKSHKKLIYTETQIEDSFNYFESPEQVIINQEDSDQIDSIMKICIGKLNPKQQEIIFLRFEHELSYEEISSILGLTVESCHTTIYRTIKSIRTEAQKLIVKFEKTRFPSTRKN